MWYVHFVVVIVCNGFPYYPASSITHIVTISPAVLLQKSLMSIEGPHVNGTRQGYMSINTSWRKVAVPLQLQHPSFAVRLYTDHKHYVRWIQYLVL